MTATNSTGSLTASDSTGSMNRAHKKHFYEISHPNGIFVLPSLTFDSKELTKIDGVAHYEQRSLYNLFLLRNPQTKVVFLSSVPVCPVIVEYYLSLVVSGREEKLDDVRKRVTFFDVSDSSPVSLSQKLLKRPLFTLRLRKIVAHNTAFTMFRSTALEQQVARTLGISHDFYHGCEAALQNFWGTKFGSRTAFKSSNCPHPDGTKLCHTPQDLATEVAKLLIRNPKTERIVVKLDEGFSGEGNGVLDTRPLKHTLQSEYIHLTSELNEESDGFTAFQQFCFTHFAKIDFCSPIENWGSYATKIPVFGAIAECFIEGAVTSPSVQILITLSGKVDILSTHEQVLRDKQIYVGCSYPARDEYRHQMIESGQRIGDFLSSQGVRGPLGVDFMTIPPVTKGKPWEIQAIEINLRQTGTTHPFLTTFLLTGSHINPETGTLTTDAGVSKYYFATDNLKKPQYLGLLPYDLITLVKSKGLHYNPKTCTGVVMHLLGCISQWGKVGCVCIHNSPKEAHDLYNQFVAAIDNLTSDLAPESNTTDVLAEEVL